MDKDIQLNKFIKKSELFINPILRKKIDHRIKMGIIMSDIKYKKSHSLPKGAKPQIEITFIILTSAIKMKQIQIQQRILTIESKCVS